MTAQNIIISTNDLDSNGISDDVDALARVAKDEAQGLVSTIKAQNPGMSDAKAREKAVGTIIDGIINRATA